MSVRLLAFGLAVVAGTCAIIGAAGTWARTPLESIAGLDGRAGWTTLVGSAVAIGVAALNLRLRWLDFVAAVPAGLAAGVASYYALYPDNFVKGASDVSMGWGLVLSAIGSVVLFVCCVVLAILPARQTTTATVV